MAYGSWVVVTCVDIAPYYAISNFYLVFLSLSQCQGIALCYAWPDWPGSVSSRVHSDLKIDPRWPRMTQGQPQDDPRIDLGWPLYYPSSLINPW